jgi:cold shock protein
MQNGKVKFFNETKGFGFITDEATSVDIFVHVSGLVDNIKEGDLVEFETENGKKGINAVNVRVVN